MKLSEILVEKNIFIMSDGELARLVPLNQFIYSNEILELLNKAYSNQDAELLEALIIIMSRDGVDKRYSQILCKLLQLTWHDRHEDIIMVLMEVKDPDTVDCIYSMALVHPDYDDGYSMQKKCIWALKAVGTDKAVEKIKILSASDIPIVREFALMNMKEKN